MKLFYDHLILDLDEVYAEIEQLEISHEKRRDLIKVVDETTHHTVIDTILSHLNKSRHEKFLHLFHEAPHDPKHLKFLKEEVEDIEEKIQETIKELKQTLLSEFTSSPK